MNEKKNPYEICNKYRYYMKQLGNFVNVMYKSEKKSYVYTGAVMCTLGQCVLWGSARQRTRLRIYRVWRNALWKMLRANGVDIKIIRLVTGLNNNA